MKSTTDNFLEYLKINLGFGHKYLGFALMYLELLFQFGNVDSQSVNKKRLVKTGYMISFFSDFLV